MKRRPPYLLAVLVTILGAGIVAAEGIARLDCARAVDIMILVAGSFGAGAGLATVMMGRRASAPPPSDRPAPD